jgi:hypothetical protein
LIKIALFMFFYTKIFGGRERGGGWGLQRLQKNGPLHLSWGNHPPLALGPPVRCDMPVEDKIQGTDQ